MNVLCFKNIDFVLFVGFVVKKLLIKDNKVKFAEQLHTFYVSDYPDILNVSEESCNFRTIVASLKILLLRIATVRMTVKRYSFSLRLSASAVYKLFSLFTGSYRNTATLFWKYCIVYPATIAAEWLLQEIYRLSQ